MIIFEWIESDLRARYFVSINDLVGITLFSEESLAILGVILVEGVAGND